MPKKLPNTPYERPGKDKKYKSKINISPGVAVLLIVALWYVIIGRTILPQALQRFNTGNTKEVALQKVYYDFSCSEANFARLAALTLGEAEDKEQGTDAEELWYKKYYQDLKDLQISSLQEEDAFTPLTGNKLSQVMEEIFGNSDTVTSLKSKKKLNLSEVIEAYGLALQNMKNKKISYDSLAILATPTDEVELDSWQLISDKGKYYFEGLVMDPVKNETLKAATWNDHILGIIAIENKSCHVQDCKIKEVSKEQISVEIQGIDLVYEQENVLKEDEVGAIGTITIEGNKVTHFTTQETNQVDVLMSVTKDKINLEKSGSFTYQEVNIFDQTGSGKYKTLGSLPYGIRVAYTAEGDKITSLQVLGGSTLNDIRVVLTSKGDYEQQKATIVGDADYDMIYGGKAVTLSSGTTWDSESFSWDGQNEVVRIVPRTDSLLTITSMEKGEGSPSYKGIIEIKKTEKGYVLVNEVDLEDYVAGVIPSEMPTNYGIEALKAQAIAARTYGVVCLSSSKFIAYSANVDDTTASQVYNQTPADAMAYKAASSTKGLVLKCEGKLISNKFFAASCGYTANFGEVWAGESFPGSSPIYLISRQQYLGDQLVSSLQDEKNFKSFIELGADDLDAFDEESPWFRWQSTLTQEELQKLLLPALKKIGTVYPELVTYESKAGIKQEKPIDKLGKIISLKAEERGEGGNLMTLGVYAENGSVKVSTEYLIRSLFASNEEQVLTVIRNNKSKVTKMSLLPSAFFTIIEKKSELGELQSVTLEGGGNGHGVGLSQDGAQGMAERGYNAKQILTHFYPNAELVQYE